ncbi:PRC-barrel domain-containing protein [Streptomyces sp. KMM 9044]|uniref:PRC-barrel domain-containing protein n=1 Tax=Streptomyces sp. KMM 9044 TaxID=2744474 RepID=UPI0021519898|nr:PRC-barrel domain-containing protein [Streptomyces sp. KMM 9044]WAX79361.1 PRC-barrel domain-containing protein [Streptomyces sp. KMM 9044]
MNALMLASDITRRPVVTLGGEAVAQVKDVVFDGHAGQVSGFTLSGRGLFSGPLRQALPWEAVTSLGPHAVMIRDETAFESRDEVADSAEAAHGNVLGARVLTDTGTDLGHVTDVVIEVTTAQALVAGYEITPAKALSHHGRTAFIPLVRTIAVSGEALVVPAAVAEFMTGDLPSLEKAIPEFRSRMSGREA